MSDTTGTQSGSHLSASAQDRLTSITSHLRPSSTGKKYKVVVTRDLGPDVMPLLLERPELDVVVWPEDRGCDRQWFLENIKGATGALVMLSEKINDETLDAAGPSLRVVSTMSVGYDHVDLRAISSRGVRLGHTPDVLTDAVADVSIMLALMAGRNAKETTKIVQNGEWPTFTWAPFSFCGPQISSNWIHSTRTVGFIGFGRIAQATLARLIPFGYTHCLYTGNPNSTSSSSDATAAAVKAKFPTLQAVRRVSLEELAKESDVVFVLAPGGESTHHIVNEAFLKNMKKTAVLVNTSRGTLVDSDALAKALREGWLWGAGLDVVEGEPNVGADHPLVREKRCVVLPHIGSATTESRLGMATLAAKNLLAGVFGEAMPAELQLKK
ncbi:hypothetical protein K474DRAFT_1763732 [Panus rudis PR-1116 ss-1]|nr:hypothetical protein K474DRAFT_1763732 [Panus rudis PR-1116 ss-1]